MYFITTIRDVKNATDNHNRCIGYYRTLKTAEGVMERCAETLCEAKYYQYAVIEKFNSGWHPTAKLEKWYRFTRSGKGVRRIKKPEAYRHLCNFGIG